MPASNHKFITFGSGVHQPLLDLIADFQTAGDTRFDQVMMEVELDFPAYLEKYDLYARGEGLPEGMVPNTDYYRVGPDQKMLGLLALHHKLAPRLMIEGGHIGNAVRPSCRQMGYAWLMLALGLDEARSLGLEKVFITCNEDHIASARVIEKKRRELENQAISPRTRKPIRPYWIKLQG